MTSDVEVPCQDKRLAFFGLYLDQIVLKILVPLIDSIFESLKAFPRVWNIGSN